MHRSATPSPTRPQVDACLERLELQLREEARQRLQRAHQAGVTRWLRQQERHSLWRRLGRALAGWLGRWRA